MARGAARNTEQNRIWLKLCPAVSAIQTTGDTVIQFTFDPATKPADDIPEGIYFDLSAAPF